MARKTDLSKLSFEEMYEMGEAADDQIRAANAIKRTLKIERDRRAVVDLAAGLSDVQRQQLAQVLTVVPIESEESVGTPA